MNDKNVMINITTGTFFRAIVLVLFIIFLYYVRDLVAVVLFSVVLASGVEPAVAWFQRRKLPRVIAAVLVYLIAFSVFGLTFYLVIPPVVSDLSDLTVNIPTYLEKPFAIKVIHDFLPELPVSISNLLVGFAQGAQGFIERIAAGFFQATSVIFGGALSFVLIIVLSFYLAVQENGIENFLRIVTPVKHEEYILDLWFRTRNKIGAWLKGQVLLGILVGLMVFIGLTILQVKYALVFALLAGIFEIIPIFGPILASLPPIGIALLQSPSLALAVIVLYVIIQQFENHLIYPVVVRKIVGVPPMITIIALVAGAKIAGFLGMLLSVPMVTALIEFLGDIEKKKRAV